MSHLVLSTPNKPNRMDKKAYPDKANNEQYHLDYGKWTVGQAFNSQHNDWLQSIAINKRFYKGDQWIEDEDLEAFLKDTTGQTRNRIQIVHNLIRPIIEQYRGNAIRLSVNAAAKSVSQRSINRREQSLAKQLFKTDVANQFPGLGAVVRQFDRSIGENEEETTQIHNNLYVDSFVDAMNSLMRYVADLNEFQNMQTMFAQNLGLTGLIVSEAFQHGGHQRFETRKSNQFFFDRDAEKQDLTDANFMGTVTPMDASMIFERWEEISHESRKAVENYLSVMSNGDTNFNTEPGNSLHGGVDHRTNSGGRIPVYKTYWKDFDRYDYGWVLDEYGYPYLVRINFTKPGQEKPEWTEKDLIAPPDSAKNRVLFKGGKKKRKLYVDVLRYCIFIPGETVGARRINSNNEQETFDIALEWGLSPYQETDYQDLSNVKFPFKCMAWGYVDGEIFSPVDDAIDPQRFINRILSVIESQFNNAGGAGVILDEDTINPQERDQIYADINMGNPITVRTKGRGIPNSVGSYDATISNGVHQMFNIIPLMSNLIQNTTGVNEGLKGESIGQDQLVGVTELLIQRGSLMQEPFYDAIARVFVQMYQHIATVGKRYYIEHERSLSIAVGDGPAEVIRLSKDMNLEDFRAFVERENADAMLKKQADQMLTIFLESQMIDRTTFTDLFGRSTPTQVTSAMRRLAGVQAEAERRNSAATQQVTQKDAQAQEQAVQGAQQEQGRLEQREDAKESRAQDHEIDKIFAKGMADFSNQQNSPTPAP